jgi:hypothetical protein
MPSNPATAQIDTPDKLFEYFLMDVQMEPCMQTSRIRHALSSLQLFIERSLMNLEPHVFPAAINAKRWEWMKRYRVWEANRKVYLYPENWLEPELRDDKTPFFKQLESELLQGDITEDRATSVYLKYLADLETIATPASNRARSFTWLHARTEPKSTSTAASSSVHGRRGKRSNSTLMKRP